MDATFLGPHVTYSIAFCNNVCADVLVCTCVILMPRYNGGLLAFGLFHGAGLNHTFVRTGELTVR